MTAEVAGGAGPAAEAARAVAETVARRSYGRLVALLARQTRDIAAAEDALSEAFAAALERWPETGPPERPEAWLLTVARRRSIDALRRRRTVEAGEAHLERLVEELEASAAGPTDEDDRVGLMFACAHPALDPAVRTPLVLQTILGFDAASIASAFLVSPATMSQRLVRAKRKIRDNGIPFALPDASERPERLAAVLDAIYAAFGLAWADATGPDAAGRALADDALWLGRVVATRLPESAEVHGLLALMLHIHARRPARRSDDGEYVPLAEQDPARWDTGMLEAAEAALRRANDLPGTGRYQLEAAVQSAHAARRFLGASDWPSILALYDALAASTDSPVVAVNRAVALAECRGAAAGLAALDAVAGDGRLASYQPYWAARADLLARAGHADEAHAAYTRALGLERDPAVRRFLAGRQARLGAGAVE